MLLLKLFLPLTSYSVCCTESRGPDCRCSMSGLLPAKNRLNKILILIGGGEGTSTLSQVFFRNHTKCVMIWLFLNITDALARYCCTVRPKTFPLSTFTLLIEYEAVSEWVTERVLREDKTHSSGLTVSDPKSWCQINRLGHRSSVMHNVEGKTQTHLEKLKITTKKYA